MNLTIDIGNTNLMICSFNGEKIYSYKRIPIRSFYEKDIPKIFKVINKKKDNIIISSVVPSFEIKFTRFLRKQNFDYFLVKDLVAEINLKTNINNKKEIGDDRIINMFYAKELFKKSIIVVDFGTATTFDVLDKEGIYDGGVITPGIDLSLKALKDNTAKLPLVNFKKTKKVIGHNTQQAIKSGFFWGYVSMVEGLINKIEMEKKNKFCMILTGGNSLYFKNIFKNTLLVDEFFTSKALNHTLNRKNK